MLYLVFLFIFLFLIITIVFIVYVLFTKRGLNALYIGINNLSEALKELKDGNLSKQIQYRLPKMYISFNKIMRKLLQSVSFSIEEFNNITLKPLKRLCYIGADSYIEGGVAGEKMAELINKNGEVAIIQLKYNLASTALRQKGFESVCMEKYPSVKVVNVTDTYGDPEKTYECVKNLIKKYSNLQGIYVVEGLTPHYAAKAINESKKNVKLIGHDIEKEIAEYLKSGHIHASLSQNLFAQGYNSVINLFNCLSSDWKPENPRQLVDIDIITPTNINEFWDAEKGFVVSDKIRKKLLRPLKVSEKKIKIMVSGDERYPIYMQVKHGVLEAKAELEPYNVTVDWIVPDQYLIPNSPILENDKMIKFLKENITKEYNALALMVNYTELVPYLNELIDGGISVVSFNTEPLGLRGLVVGINRSAKELLNASQIVTNSSKETNESMYEITSSITQISKGTIDQNENAREGMEAVKTLDNSIENVIDNMEKQTSVIKNFIATGASLNNSVVKMNQQITAIDNIQEKVDLSVDKIHHMMEKSSKMVEIIRIIEDISVQINLLALNASIQAAHAGVHGKSFNVVADEIRGLANLTNNSISDVSKLISEFKAILESANITIKESKNVVDTEIKNLKSATEEMNELTETYIEELNAVSKVVENTNETTKIMKYNSSRVIKSINEIVAVSEENSAASAEISATTIEIARHTESIVQLASNLSLMAHTLQGAIFQFDLGMNSNEKN